MAVWNNNMPILGCISDTTNRKSSYTFKKLVFINPQGNVSELIDVNQ